MKGYLLRRIGQALIVLWAAWTVAWLVLWALPGDAVEVRLGIDANGVTAEQADALRASLGLDQPWPVQYLTGLGRAMTGDLGTSWENGRPVTSLVAEGLAATLAVTSLALLLAVVFGAGLALLATGTRHPRVRRTLLNLPPLGVAIPGFWLGLILLEVFSFRLALFPAIGNDGFASLVLPAVTLAVPTSAMIAQLLTRSLQDALDQPWADTARAKGARPSRVLLGHAFRNAALPALTITGLIVGQLLSGAVVAETVFSRTGLGRLTASAVTAQDTPVVQGIVLFAALVFVTVNLVVDLLYPLLDRRILPRAATKEPRP